VSSNREPLIDGLVEEDALRERVRARYAELAGLAASGARCGCGQPVDCGCGADCCTSVDENQPGVAAELYPVEDRAALPETAVLASLGCGNPTAVAELREGEVVLDLGSGGGIDALLSAKRVGPNGKAYGLDMTEQLLALARRNTEQAGAHNVEFLKGHIEAIPLPAATVDIVSDVPEVLFVCVHNAGRSQIAAALLDHHAKGRVHVRSARQPPRRPDQPRRDGGHGRVGHRPVPRVPQAAHRRIRQGGRRGHHHGLRGCLPDLPGQALRGLGAPGPGRPARRGGPPHPRRDPRPRAAATG
jgi:SAM-dependent methyltransferase